MHDSASVSRHARLSMSLVKSKSIEEHCFSLWYISIIKIKIYEAFVEPHHALPVSEDHDQREAGAILAREVHQSRTAAAARPPFRATTRATAKASAGPPPGPPPAPPLYSQRSRSSLPRWRRKHHSREKWSRLQNSETAKQLS